MSTAMLLMKTYDITSICGIGCQRVSSVKSEKKIRSKKKKKKKKKGIENVIVNIKNKLVQQGV